MRWLIICALTILGSLLAGCRIPQPVSNSSAVSIEQPLVVEIWADKDLAQVGQTIRFRATLTNKGTGKQVVELRDRPVFDLVVSDGTVTSRWSDGKPLTPELTRLELKPGESKFIELDYVVHDCCNSIGAMANFIDSDKFADFPTRPSIIVSVGSYEHGAFP